MGNLGMEIINFSKFHTDFLNKIHCKLISEIIILHKCSHSLLSYPSKYTAPILSMDFLSIRNRVTHQKSINFPLYNPLLDVSTYSYCLIGIEPLAFLPTFLLTHIAVSIVKARYPMWESIQMLFFFVGYIDDANTHFILHLVHFDAE